MKNKLTSYVKRIVKLISLQEMQILPGHLAFNIILMIIPIFSIIGVLGNSLGFNNIPNGLKGNIPDAVMIIIESALNLESSGFNMLLFIIFSLWMVSGGCRAISISSDVLYKVKNVSKIKTYIKSFLMVLVLFILIGFVIVVPVLGDFIVNFLNNYLKEEGAMIITNIYHLLKYPLSIILMFILIKFLYTMSPNFRIKSKYMNTGAWFTTISWFTLIRVYSYHLNNYSNYNLYYGSLSNLLILFVWIYLLSYLFTIGLALNADNYLRDKE